MALTTPLIDGPNGVEEDVGVARQLHRRSTSGPARSNKAMSCVDELMPGLLPALPRGGRARRRPTPIRPSASSHAGWSGRWHGAEAAAAAEAAFDRQFKQGRAAADAPRIRLPDGDPVHMPALLADNGLAGSRGEARRLIAQGAVRVNGTPLAGGRAGRRPGSAWSGPSCGSEDGSPSSRPADRYTAPSAVTRVGGGCFVRRVPLAWQEATR